MYSLFKKEINAFLGSFIGYIVIIVFLVVNGLFLWVFPGNFNIPDNGYATLQGLFDLAPWVYLFLVPAVTMRLFAEERRTGTMELLITRPLSEWQIILAKFLAGLTLATLSLLPTLIYFFSVIRLGNPVGNIDVGGTWGAYIGLFFLAAIYTAIGVFSSAISQNQIVAFITSVVLCFVLFIGFDFWGGLDISAGVQALLTSMGINEHYESISRGVVDSRDLTYFIFVGFTILWATTLSLKIRQRNILPVLRRSALTLLVLIVVAWGSSRLFFRIDLTAEKRYSLSTITHDILKQQDKMVMVEVYLDGELPAGFQKLQNAITEKIEDFDAWGNKPVHYRLINPYTAVAAKERNNYFNHLVSIGLVPTDLRRKTDEGVQTHLIFPGVIIRSGDDEVSLNLLKNNPRMGADENLNHSIETLEYELVRGFKLLHQQQKERIAFLTGHGELDEWEVKDISYTLSENYSVSRITVDSLLVAPEKYKAVVVADPKKPFPERDKFIVDQYIMQGGRTLWLIDPVQVSLDSLSRGMTTVAFPRDLKLRDQLFRYGVRINPNLMQDADCLLIPLVSELPNGQTKQTPVPWYYSPLVTPADEHVIGRNLNRVKSEFVSGIDVVGENDQLKSSVILRSSKYARLLRTPLEVSLASANHPVDRSLFNQQDIPVGVLLEGTFNSVFINRMLQFEGINTRVMRNESMPNKMIVVADGNMLANQVRRMPGQQPQIARLGYDRFSGQTFGNKDFFVNAINYLCDDSGLMELRSRVVKLRLLDKVKVREEKFKWQLINIVLPLLLFMVMGIAYNAVRRRKYLR